MPMRFDSIDALISSGELDAGLPDEEFIVLPRVNLTQQHISFARRSSERVQKAAASRLFGMRRPCGTAAQTYL